MSFFGKNTRETLTVSLNGKDYELEGDDMLLFDAKVARGRPFEFTFPGETSPTEVEINGLRTVRKVTVAQE